MVRIVEGKWEDLRKNHDEFIGKTVRIIVDDAAPVDAQNSPGDAEQALEWMRANAVKGTHADWSRDSIYTGTLDDTR